MRVPKLRTHSTGQYRVTIDGKTHYLGNDPSIAERKYRGLIADLMLPGELSGDSGQLISDLWPAFVKDQESVNSPRWWAKKLDKLKHIEAPLLRLYGHLPVNAFGPRCFHEVRKELASKGRSRAYVNELSRKLRQAFGWGVGRELVDPGVLQKLQAVPMLKRGELGLVDNERVEGVDWKQIEATIPFLSDRNADVIRLLCLTAARPDELLRLKPSDVVDGVYRPRHHKTERWNRRRVIPFGPVAMAILSKYPGGFDWLGGAHSLYTAVRRACERGKIPYWFPYQIRHAALSRISLQHGKEIAQLVAGHSSPSMTERYDHSGEDKVRRLAS